jgi:hypothetical protein
MSDYNEAKSFTDSIAAKLFAVKKTKTDTILNQGKTYISIEYHDTASKWVSVIILIRFDDSVFIEGFNGDIKSLKAILSDIFSIQVNQRNIDTRKRDDYRATFRNKSLRLFLEKSEGDSWAIIIR